jgi:hypothetical protein
MKRNCLTDEIDCFLRSGDYDPLFRQWLGSDVVNSITRGSHALRDALLKEIWRREGKSLKRSRGS